MTRKFKLCINSQTPLVRFKVPYQELLEKYPGNVEATRLSEFIEGADYDYSPGGVTTMLRPAVKQMIEQGIIEKPAWVSLGPGSPERIDAEIANLYNIWLDREQLSLYANFKEGIWNEIHGLGTLSFKAQEYEAYVGYNWLCSKIMLEMLKDVDLYWIHDFQQLHVGNLIGPSAPAILRWHIPFDLEKVSDRLRTLVVKSIEGFDSIVVSTKRDLQGLIHAGYRGRAYAMYPYLDEREWSQASENSVEQVKSKLSLKNEERILLIVARMDPIKAQDVAIKALASISSRYPDTRLVLAGNGSFTGSSKGGLGHPKSNNWKGNLENLISSLAMKDSVTFAGHVNHDELNALYSMAEVVIVPSTLEGFNLTAVEGWLHKKACLVSQGAGVSELVHNEVNGYTFDSSDYADCARKLDQLLSSPEKTVKMGENGASMAKQCYVENAVEAIKKMFEETSAGYMENAPQKQISTTAIDVGI